MGAENIAEDGLLEEQFAENLLAQSLRQGIGGYQSDYTKARAEANARYLGKPYAEDVTLPAGSLSRFLDRTAFDTVELILPKLVKVFHGSSEAVKFTASGAVSDEVAQQQTDLCNYCYNVENDGFQVTLDILKSGLIEGISVAAVRWEDREIEQVYRSAGLSPEQLAFLDQEPDVEIVNVQPEPGGTLSAELRRRVREGRCVVERVLSEEFRYDGDARSLGECNFLARVWPVSRSALIARGFDPEVIEAASVHVDQFEQQTRQRQGFGLSGHHADPSLEYVTYGEAWIRADLDGDGREEWRKFCFVGPDTGLQLLSQAVVDDQPFVVCSPIPIPGSVEGLGIVESVSEIQGAKTDVLRSILDALYTRSNPRLQVPISETLAFDDLFGSSDPNAPVRVITPGAIQPIVDGYDPSPAYQLVALLDQLRELRSGVSQLSGGGDADVLRGQTATAIQAAQTAAGERIELIIRIYAELFFKPMFRKILREHVRNVDRPRTIAVRGRSVDVDPRAWTAEANLSVAVGLGTGRKAETQGALVALLGMMRELAASGSQLVNEQTIYRALIEYARSLDIGSPEAFFIDPATLPPPAPAEPQLEPLEKAEQMRARGAIAREEIKTQRDLTIERIRDDRARDQSAQDLALRLADIFGEFDSSALADEQTQSRPFEDQQISSAQ